MTSKFWHVWPASEAKQARSSSLRFQLTTITLIALVLGAGGEFWLWISDVSEGEAAGGTRLLYYSTAELEDPHYDKVVGLMTSVGNILRKERESQSRAMAEIAEELCITQGYLLAIEEDDLKNLPGIFFYKSFAKQYAAVLGLDEKLLRPGFDALVPSEERGPVAIQDVPYSTAGADASSPPVRTLDPIVQDTNRRYFSDRRLGVSVVGLVAVLLACSGFYSWWNKASRPGRATEPAPISTPAGVATVASHVASQKDDAAPVLDVSTTTGSDGVNHVVLSVSATEKTWLSITSEGKQVFSGILEPSQTKTLTGLEAAKMRVGNAGGLEVRWNGKPIGPIGPRGQVRVVLFTPENFQILQPSETL